ncbi:DNA/RNA helicase [Leucobacter coleopterorum]|uniref:DNA/RNA helicase n=1 Tax=Leucobacter coleopterorum TaxID=2714933 RepID=A0ABX6JT88_9MICO|nr:DNA/RNA helicase [Leucobacter coleopterorum]QIM17515.1 DNA/RNA helicase [Leucobacter coleopterorum]
MKLSRKRRRELRRLRGEAQELLDHQRVVLSHAGEVLHEASRQARKLSDEHVAPRVDVALEAARPTIDRGVESARRAVKTVRRTATPLVASALASTIQKLDQLEQVEASRQVRGFGERTGFLQPAKKKRRAGGVIAIGFGIAAAVGVGYALWQAFRTDDELWVAPEGE